ncbi:MAG: hypothetical protein ACWGOY_11190 [Anaerolineales bacterium]
MVIGMRNFKTILEHLTQTAGRLVITYGLLLGILLVSCSIINPDSFAMVGGDEQLVVLLRHDQDGHYQVRFEGSKPTQLNSLQVMLGGQILHVDVARVAIIQGDQEVILEGDGTVPEGSQVIFDPDEEFEVRVTYHGQTLGGNYMYGFRMVYGDNPQAEPVDLIAEYQYAVIVE